MTLSTPVTQRAITDPVNVYTMPMGTGGMIDLSTPANIYLFGIYKDTVDTCHARTSAVPTVAMTNTAPITIAVGANGTGDEFYATITYEAAS